MVIAHSADFALKHNMVGGAEGSMTLKALHTSFKINLDYSLESSGSKNQISFQVSSISHDFPQKFISLTFEGNSAAKVLNEAVEIGKTLIADRLVDHIS